MSSTQRTPIPLAQHIPTLIFITVTVLTSSLVSRTQPTPYIDEIFHIPQAQRCCQALSGVSIRDLGQVWRSLRGVEYDPKLTTPPGLYAISVGLAKVLPGWECDDVVWLRSTNLVLLLTLPVFVARILRQHEEQAQHSAAIRQLKPPAQTVPAKTRNPISRRDIQELQAKAKLEQPPTPDASQDDLPDISPPTVTLTNDAPPPPPSLPRAAKRKEAAPHTMAVACTICFLPPLWFFGFLYYTDLASVWLVLACWTLYSDLNRNGAVRTGCLVAVVSMLAVLVRQTNIVWVGFCAAQAVLARVLAERKGSGLVGEVRALLEAALGKKRRQFWRVVAINAAPMLPMLLGCVWFIRWNGSIVLGDKTNHQAGLHAAQMGYFVAFATGFGLFPLLLALQPSTSAGDASRSMIGSASCSVRTAIQAVFKASCGSASGIAALAALLAAFYVAVDKYTIEHPFLLADNRHYTFYVWRMLQRSFALPGMPVLRPLYAMVPVYAVALFAWCTALRNCGCSVLLGLVLWGATAATLIPTPLIEPRYYLIPYIVLRILCHREGKKWRYVMAELAMYAAVNVVTVALFVAKPFGWPAAGVDGARGEGTTMRFIW